MEIKLFQSSYGTYFIDFLLIANLIETTFYPYFMGLLICSWGEIFIPQIWVQIL